MYDREKIEQRCIEAIEIEELTAFCDLVSYVEPALSTLYEWGLEKSEGIKNALAKNRIAAKAKMRKKWINSDNPALQIAAYKLYADEQELELLTINKVDNKHRFPEGVQIVFNKAGEKS